MAIRAQLQFDDPVSAITLAGAAESVLSDLQPQSGILGIDAWSVQACLDLYIKDEFHGDARDMLRHGYDFLRHADGKKEGKRPCDALTLHQASVDFFLLLGVKAYTALGNAASTVMRAFICWMMMERPNWFRDECPGRNEMALARSNFPNLTKSERFAALLAVIESQS